MSTTSEHESVEPPIITNLAVLQTVIANRLAHRENDMPFVLACIGGSASGKTILAQQIAQNQEVNTLVVAQDNFQLGIGFVEKASPYRWDDPKNFSLDLCEDALRRLKSGQHTVIPQYNFATNKQEGFATLFPQDLIIFEGIYAALTNELASVADLLIYIDIPYPLRILRRIARPRKTATDDPANQARQMLTSVFLAEKVFGQSQKAKAVLIYKPDIDNIEDTIGNMQSQYNQVTSENLNLISLTPPIKTALWNNIEFNLYSNAFAIFHKQTPIYIVPLEESVMKNAMQQWEDMFT